MRIMVIGLGPIGTAAAGAIASERHMSLAGLVDVDETKQGRTLAELSGWQPAQPGQEAAQRVTGSLEEALAHQPDVAVVATASRLEAVAPLVRDLLQAGVAVLSTCEELVWPWYAHGELAAELDEQARQADRAVLGVGVNPGFVLDVLPVVLATMVRRVHRVYGERRVNTALRRRQLQAKLGATLNIEQFEHRARQGQVGHAGLAESLALLAAGLGRQVEPGSIELSIEPILAQQPRPSDLGLVLEGHVLGAHQTASWNDDDLSLELDLTMALGCDNPGDLLNIEGPVSFQTKIPGGLPGDSCTVATLLNHARCVHKADPGLRSVLDIAPAGCRAH